MFAHFFLGKSYYHFLRKWSAFLDQTLNTLSARMDWLIITFQSYLSDHADNQRLLWIDLWNIFRSNRMTEKAISYRTALVQSIKWLASHGWKCLTADTKGVVDDGLLIFSSNIIKCFPYGQELPSTNDERYLIRKKVKYRIRVLILINFVFGMIFCLVWLLNICICKNLN